VSIAVEAAPALTARSDPAAGASRRRLAFWRSPAGQPAWARPTLLAIAGLAALLYSWHLAGAGLAPFYSTAVKSMSESWKAFFFGAFDPRATLTIDKLAGSFLPQALSARIFGFHAWSLALPQVIEGSRQSGTCWPRRLACAAGSGSSASPDWPCSRCRCPGSCSTR
jgi:hypothetical protein